jgi:hypothetical protein
LTATALADLLIYTLLLLLPLLLLLLPRLL